MSDIKSMGLYRNVERIMADLADAGFGDTDRLRVSDLTPYDQYHYEGTDAVDDAIAALELGSDDHVLDIGSGLGGPARYIAEATRARVTALEIQTDLDQTATELTRRCGLDSRVEHVAGDILSGSLAPDTYTAAVSMLCILHIDDRATLFANLASCLRPGGRVFIDDYVALGPFTDAERAALADTVYCRHLPSIERYAADLADAGFVDVVTTDMTSSWQSFVTARLAAFRAARADLVGRYGTPTVDSLDHFYSTVADLFEGGRLGGIRITASLRRRR